MIRVLHAMETDIVRYVIVMVVLHRYGRSGGQTYVRDRAVVQMWNDKKLVLLGASAEVILLPYSGFATS
jgi:hypothetical protein